MKLSIQEQLAAPQLTHAQALVLQQEITHQVQSLQARTNELQAQAMQLVGNSASDEDLRALAIDQQTNGWRVAHAQKLLTEAQGKVVELEQTERAAALKAKWNDVRGLLKQRNAELDKAEEALSIAASHIALALEHTNKAIAHAPTKPHLHEMGFIREGMRLLPAFKARLGFMAGVERPQDEVADHQHAKKLGSLSEVLQFECDKILSPAEH